MKAGRQRWASVTLAVAAMLVSAGCHKKDVYNPPPLPEPVATAPTATLTASPDTIQPGQSSTLTWSTTGASDITISTIGPVKASGSTTVTPTATTTYSLIARGDTGTGNASATVTVSGAGAAAPAADTSGLTNDQIFHQQVADVFFDYDSYTLNPDGQAAITKAVTFLNANPQVRVLIGGYCDSRGSTEYNLALGASRADAAKDALVKGGVNASRLRTVSYGKEKQFCTEENESCWQQNRRAAFSVDK